MNSSRPPLLKKIFFGVVIIKLSILSGLFVIEQWAARPGLLPTPTTLYISRGTSLGAIAEQLAATNAIQSPWLFTLAVRVSQYKGTLQSGEYLLPAYSSPAQIIALLRSGQTVTHRLTFAEGLSTYQILTIIANDPALEGPLPAKVEEGMLLPETYFYKRGEKRIALVERMRLAMQETLTAAWNSRSLDVPFTSPYEALILASIVEKETGFPNERPRIAAVFLNRIARGMRLQADPTVIYGLTNGRYDLNRSLTSADLQMENPYNTYTIHGLPPTPIANPGRAAIQAVMNPERTSVLYFVVDSNGGHRFATTLEEHNRNVRAYRQWMKSLADN